MSGSTAEVWIDEQDVTSYALSGSSTRRLNRPSQATVTMPYDAPIFDTGKLMKVYFDGILHHHGRILQRELDMDENYGQVVYSSTDPFELWALRPARDGPNTITGDQGDFSKPVFIEDFLYGPQIIEQLIIASEDPGGVPADSEGPLFIAAGGFEQGVIDLTGAPTDWPMTMAQVASMLCSTGVVDIIMTPIELTASGYFYGGGAPVYNYGQVDVFNGDFGLDLRSSVAFQYGFGLKNIRAFRWNEDMTNVCNKLWYYLGPRVGTSDDPAGDQHWRANIQATDGGLASPPQADIDLRVGSLIGNSTPPGDSRASYGVRMDIKIYDARGDEATVGRELYRRLWQIEAWLRALPLTLVHITPTRDTDILAFDIGDLVTVECTPDVAGGFSGVQRVYEYTIGWDSDSVVTLDEVQTSSDNEGFDTG